MRFIEFIPLCLVFVSRCLAAPPHNINFQGDAGQYSFNYEEPMSSRTESRSSDGMTRGTYSYFDANGQLQTAEYEAGQNLGFNIKATNLPQAPLPITEAPEVLVARQKHLQLLNEANRQESNGALQGINHGLPDAPETIQRSSFPKDSLHFHDTTGAKKDSMKELNRPVETQSERHLRLNAPIAGAQLIPEANRKIFAFPGWENGPIPDFPAGHYRDVNFPPKGIANLPNFPKGYDHFPSLPMGDGNFNQFLKGNPEFPSLPKSGAAPVPLSSFSPFSKENTNFPSFPNIGTDFSPKGNFNFPPFLTSNEFSSSQKSRIDALPSSNVSPFLKENTNFPSYPNIGTDFSPKVNFNFPPFLTSNEFSSSQKSGTDALPSPSIKENLNFPSLPKSGADSSLQLNEKSEFMPSNGVFSSVPKSDATTEPLLKNDASSESFPKENVKLPLPNNSVDTFPLLEGRVNSNPFLKDQVINNPNDKISPTLKSNVEDSLSPLPKNETPSTISEETPKQRDAVSMPSPSGKTPEAAVIREAQLQSVSEAVSKSSKPSVTNAPEDLSARGAHLKFADDPETARLFFEVPKFTPEVQAAREAHFRAHALAAKLAVESDINPKILELFLGRPGEPKLGSQKIAELENLLLKGVTDEGIKRFMENPAMMMEAPMKGIDTSKENMPMTNDNRGINNLMEKPQLKELLKVPQIQLATEITPAGTSLKIPDTRVASIDEFQQSKQKAEINLKCGTALKVKDLNDNKSEEDQRLIIVKSGNPTPFLSNVPLPIDQSEQWRNNWALQYMSV